ncbi:MAG: CBS domain-containing protein [Eubacteriales bacterium]
MIVRDIMTRDVVTVPPSANVVDIAKIMKSKDVGCILVADNGRLLGVVTDRDIVVRVVREGKDINQIKAEQCMTLHPVSVEINETIDQAAEIMAENQVKRLPVIGENKIVGVIALGDLAVEVIHMDEAGEALNGISQGITH